MSTPLPVATPAATRRAVRALLRPHRPAGVLAALTLLAATVAGLLVPPLFGRIVDVVEQGRGADAVTAPVLLLLVLALAQGTLTGLGTALVARVAEPMLAELRERVVARALDLPSHAAERAGRGDVLARVGDDVAAVARAAREALAPMAGATLTVGLTIVGLAALDPRLALAGLCAVPAQALTLRWYLRRAAPVYAAERAAGSRRAQQLVDSLGAAGTVRAYGLSREHGDLVAARSQEAVDLTMRAVRLQTGFFARLNGAELVGTAAILLAGFLLVRDGAVTVGEATAAALYFVRLFDPINTMLGLVDELQSATASLARLVGVAGLPPRDAPARRGGGPGLRLRGIRHGYGPGREVLHGVDLHVAPGEHVALVGVSGAGKSTLARIASGALAPAAGTVEAGGAVVLVTQELHVFAGPLADDLRLAKPGAADDELHAALERVGAGAWVRALPEGLHTVVGEGGHRLGPTETQQLALARLVLADPAVAVLDEATAEAGSAGARVLEAAAARALEGRSALVVAHRLTQAAAADRVVVLADGRVVEQGTHDALVAAGGAYAALWRAWAAPRDAAA